MSVTMPEVDLPSLIAEALASLPEALAEAVRTALKTAEPLPPKKLFTAAECQAITGLPAHWWEAESRAGHIPSRKPGGPDGKYRRWSMDDIDAVLAVCADRPTSGPYLKGFIALEKQRSAVIAA